MPSKMWRKEWPRIEELKRRMHDDMRKRLLEVIEAKGGPIKRWSDPTCLSTLNENRKGVKNTCPKRGFHPAASPESIHADFFVVSFDCDLTRLTRDLVQQSILPLLWNALLRIVLEVSSIDPHLLNRFIEWHKHGKFSSTPRVGCVE